MLNTLKCCFVLLGFIVLSSISAQTQEEIENMLNDTGVVEVEQSKPNDLVTKTKDKKVKVEKEQKVKVEKIAKVKKEKVVKTKEDVEVNVSDVLDLTKNKKLKGSASKFKKKGDEYGQSGAHYNAMNSYQAALLRTKKKRKLAKLNLLAGESALMIRNYALSEVYFKDCLIQNSNKKKFDVAYFYLANSLKYQAKYVEAKDWYGKFMLKAANNSSLALEKSKSRIASKGCTYAMDLVVEEPAYVIENPGENVNGPYADFSPEIRGKELIYAKILSDCSEEESKDIAKLYTSDMYDMKFNLAQDFSSTLNQGNDFVCNPSFSADGKTIYFSKCQLVSKSESHCDIYRSVLVEGIWGKAVKLEGNLNEENSSSSHPQIVEDEEGYTVFYFTSNRESGRGGKDIWYAVMNEDGDFGRAKNMGSPVNTRFDDISPFYHPATQTLYYSTDGEIGLGGYDVFAAKKSNDGWEEPKNLETPVNTSLDDYDFILDAKGERGFLVSNRTGTTSLTGPTCCDDIFEVRSTQIELFVSSAVYVEGPSGREVLEDGLLVLEDLNTGKVDSIKIDIKDKFVSINTESEYRITALSEKYESKGVEFNTLNSNQSDTLYYDLFLTDKKNEIHKEFIGIIYYKYAESRLTPEAPATLETIIAYLKLNPKSQVEVRAHTDGKGPAEFNLNLSESRCDAAVNFLKSEGIEVFRIKNKWFGESEPAAPNTNEDGSDNPEGRALNRRTEFKITGLYY
ncbi:MAG: OOP family OmpA-OmpF porin [Bacteroidia bacterium]|jgi:OOP family OmpA-OmpF porin